VSRGGVDGPLLARGAWGRRVDGVPPQAGLGALRRRSLHPARTAVRRPAPWRTNCGAAPDTRCPTRG
jgi:hypothetical protein